MNISIHDPYPLNLNIKYSIYSHCIITLKNIANELPWDNRCSVILMASPAGILSTGTSGVFFFCLFFFNKMIFLSYSFPNYKQNETGSLLFLLLLFCF